MTQETWYQQALTPPEVWEATVKVGVIPAADHVQTWWEVKDPTNGVLVGQGAVAHTTLHGLRSAIERAVDAACQEIYGLVEPF